VIPLVKLKYLLPSEISFFPFPPVFTAYFILLFSRRCKYICIHVYCVFQPVFFLKNFMDCIKLFMLSIIP
jgi:hypothetical protein